MPAWPGTLPQKPLQSGFNESLKNLVITTQMDSGPAKVRRRFTAGVKKYSVSFLMTSDQLSTFEIFYNDTILGGALSFDFPDPRTGTTGIFRIDMSQGAPKIQTNSGNQFFVEFAMEKLP
jgi:hypothetical protein